MKITNNFQLFFLHCGLEKFFGSVKKITYFFLQILLETLSPTEKNPECFCFCFFQFELFFFFLNILTMKTVSVVTVGGGEGWGGWDVMVVSNRNPPAV